MAAKLFYQYGWKLYNLLNNLISNQESQFILEFWKLMCQRLCIDAWLLIVYYFETDG